MKLDNVLKVFALICTIIGAVWFLQNEMFSIKLENRKQLNEIELSIRDGFFTLEKKFDNEASCNKLEITEIKKDITRIDKTLAYHLKKIYTNRSPEAP